MAYDERTIEQVQSLNDIVEVLSGYIQLKRAGRSFKALCPFHQEKTPSFIVNPERQAFHCFGCNEGGDVFSFVMKHEHVSFPEAVRMLAERVHFTLPESKYQPASAANRSHGDQLYKLYGDAAAYYRFQFLKSQSDGAGKARMYWKNRGFGDSEAENFGIGYALEEWRGLFEHLSKKGYQQDTLFQSGLIARSSQGQPYDLFRHRLMFPILNAQGRVIALGGRVLGDGQPKYLNSPETEIFKKRREFYGMFTAKKSLNAQGEIRRLIIVEGYLDCIQLQVHGFPNTVATLGTALTNEHVRVLKRYADEAIVVYDGDQAGESAALRGLDIFIEEGMNVRALSLPKGLDPDDFIRAKGEQALKDAVQKAQDFFDFKLEILLQRFNKADSIGLLKITSEFLDTFTKIQNPVLLDRYLKKLAANLGVDERSLRSELQKLQSKKETSRETPRTPPEAKPSTEPIYEKLILALIMHYPPHLDEFRDALPAYQFQGRKTKELFQLLNEYMSKSGEDFSGARFLNRIKDHLLKTFASELLVMEWSGQDRERGFRDCLHKMQQVQIDSRLKELRHQITRAEEVGDQSAVGILMREYQDLLTSSGKKSL